MKPMLGAAHEVVALNNISLSIRPGKALAVVGESWLGQA